MNESIFLQEPPVESTPAAVDADAEYEWKPAVSDEKLVICRCCLVCLYLNLAGGQLRAC